MFLGWYDPDKKKPAIEKAEDAIARFVEKFGIDPELVLVGPTTALDLGDRLPVHTASYIPANTFYVGSEAGAPTVQSQEETP